MKESKSKLDKIVNPYKQLHTAKSLLLITVACVIIVFGLNVFVLPAGIIPAGTSGIAQTIVQLLTRTQAPATGTSLSTTDRLFGIPLEAFFYVFWVLINIPIVIFGFIKVGKKFTFYTLYFMLFQTAWGIGWTYIPGLRDLSILQITDGNNEIITGAGADAERVIAGVLGAFFVGIPIALTFKAGGCAGGTDFFVAYVSRKKEGSIGKWSTIINLSIVAFGVFLLYFLLEVINDNEFLEAFSSEVAATIIYILLSSFFVDKYFPINKKLSVNVITNEEHILPIEDQLSKAGYIRSYTVLPATSGRDKMKKSLLIFTISFLEKDFVIKNINKVAPTAFITYTENMGVDGYFKRPDEGEQ